MRSTKYFKICYILWVGKPMHIFFFEFYFLQYIYILFLYIKYSKFWSVSLEYFIKCKPLISEECNIPNGKYLPNQNEICTQTHVIHIVLLLRLKNGIATNKTSKWSFSTSIMLINLSFLKSKFWYMYFLKIHVRKNLPILYERTHD